MPADPAELFTAAERSAVRRNLPRWFARHARDLPWRRDRDPYRIWVSEVMLQQTQVAAVIPYFERFLARFPDLPSLAAATEHDVLLLWQGLGYYRRARDLHASARRLATEHGGTIPDDPAVLARLPGFGRYTVNAVLSQAFDRRLPILEANSQRVLARLLALPGDLKDAAVRSTLWRAAEESLPARSPGEFNQALMELGALVCTPSDPACERCPLARTCRANRGGLQDVIPPPAKKAATVLVDELAVVLRDRGRVLLVRRPAAGRWANMWEFPRTEVEAFESHAAAARRLLASVGFEGEVEGELLTVRHAVTRFRITLVCLAARRAAGRFAAGAYPTARWVRVAELDAYPISVPQRQIVARLRAGGGPE